MAAMTWSLKISLETKGGVDMNKRLIKSTDKKIFGVAGGVAEYFDIEPNLVRIGFVVLGVCSLLVAVVAYLGLAVVTPSPLIAPVDSDSAPQS